MYTQLTTSQDNILNASLCSVEHYSIPVLTRQFYQASHKNKNIEAQQLIKHLEHQIYGLNRTQNLNAPSCATLQNLRKPLLVNVTEAVLKFEASYTANYLCASFLPSPCIKRLKRLSKNAELALRYI